VSSAIAGEIAASELSDVARYVPERNPLRVYLARLGAGSRPTMAEALERIARIASGGTLEAEAFPWHLLRYQHVTAVRTALMGSVSERTGKPLGPATVNKALSALRGVLREAWRLGLMSAEDLARATDFAPVRGSTVLRGRALASHEVAALFHVCSQDSTAAGPRDAVILALGVAAGLRRAEIASLDLADLDLGRELVRVHGKGRKLREVPVKNGTLDALRAWLACRGYEPGPLVCPVRKGGRVELRRLAPQAILRVCEKRAQEAGIKEFAAHDLRRTYISALLDQGVDLSVASELAGHSSPSATKRCDRRGERARHAAAETIVVPYVWRGRGE
jgi:integrase